MAAFYIYALLCDKTDDIIYVGQTKRPSGRLRDHIYSIKNGTKPIYNHFRNHNSIPIMILIEKIYAPFTNEPKVLNKEKDWIESFKKCGFNILN